MDVGLFEAPEEMVRLCASLEQNWKQIQNIRRKLKNPDIPEGKKSILKRKELEAQSRIVDLNAKHAKLVI